MEKAQKITRPLNNRKGANILSIITFAYTLPTFRKGLRKDLDEEDITEHLESHDSKILGDRLDKAWKRELLHKKPSLWRAVRKVFGIEFLILGVFLMFIDLVVKISPPLALSQLIKFYTKTGTENSITLNEAYMYAGIIVGGSFVNVLSSHAFMMCLQHFGMKLRVAFCSIIYRKSLRINKSVLEGLTVGQMVNLLSNDVNRCDRAIIHVHNLWLSPIQAMIVIEILYYSLGLSSIVGIFFIAFFVPLQMYFGKKTSTLRLKTALRTDKRVRLMNEIICGIQVIKMYTWEKPFAKVVAITRRLEMRHIRAISYIRAVVISFSIFTRFAIFLTVLTYFLLGRIPNAEYVFVVTSFYNIVRQALTMYLPRGITELAELNISVSRLQKFLLYDEIENKKLNNESINSFNNKMERSHIDIPLNKTQHNMKIGVELKCVSAKWSSNLTENTLGEIDFKAEAGQLIAVIGAVGSGKTSLLHVILKELPVISGNLEIHGSISYASQEPWIFLGSVQQNILFGQAMDVERYLEVVKVCALEKDFCLLPFGDDTIVGERGVTLSGGQRARVSLARAIYKEADIYLLDDPLSAVDTHVGKQLFDECISKYLRHKCTILVTHQLQYLQNVNRLFLLENGKVAVSGTYNELQKSGNDFAKQFNERKEENGESSGDIETYQVDVKSKKSERKDNAQEEIKEHRSSGKISGEVYLSYCKAGGSLITGLIVLFLYILSQVSVSATDYFLGFWVNLEQQRQEHTDNKSLLSSETCIYIYSGIVSSLVIITLFRSCYFFKYCMTASTRLHDRMFFNIVQASMRFFNTNSSGRILNRFSKDMGAIDEILPMVAIDCIQVALNVVGVTVVISLINPWLLFVTAIILIVFYVLRVIYMKTSRSVKRLEGITRSPVFAHMSMSLQGITTIRAFGAESILEKEFDDHQNLHSSVWYMFLASSRAFGFWLDMICVLYIVLVTFSFFFTESEQYGGNVGLAITQAISLMGLFQWGMRQWTELENQMTSVERVVEYTTIEHEANTIAISTPKGWPAQGGIDFIDVSLRYSSLEPYVLKSLNFKVKPKEKIGIVGRTGAGKSSLIYALFQLTKIEGKILIDDIDISKISVHNLRSKISIIPQEPVLFSGSLRKNMDPFDEFPDADLWKALEEVELKHVVEELPHGLHSNVSEGGSNFSVGQRQLLCLARAIIRKNKILILDEATANVDPQTDTLIQTTIRIKFADCTVLTIAHRLHTIMDSNKVLIMDSGSVVEFDHPHLLLQNQNSLFYGMVQKTGHAMADVLLKIAENSYKDVVL